MRKRLFQSGLLFACVLVFLGAGDESTRFNDLGHRMMCMCGCNQILLECNHVGCTYSDRMRAELMAAVDRGDSIGQVLDIPIPAKYASYRFQNLFKPNLEKMYKELKARQLAGPPGPKPPY